MKRNVDLNEISDGRLYSANDMVKVECGDCAGCSACCQNMGTSVVLDPMDIWKMQRGTGRMLEKTMEAMRAAGDTPYVIGEIKDGEKGVTLC